MYCSECGQKNEKGAAFCQECGAALEVEEKEEKTKETEKEEKTEKTSTKKVVEKPKKKMPFWKKALIVIAIVLVVGLFAGYQILKGKTDPKAIVEEYMEALRENDTEKMYKYYDLSAGGDFTSRKMFKEYFSSKEKKQEAKKISNYRVMDAKYSGSGLTATVNVSYTTAGKQNTMTVTLNKAKDKKYMFFDDWKITTNPDDFATDFTFTVPKGSTVTLGGVELGKSYLSEYDSDTYDEYEIPMLFKMKYDVKATLPAGFVIEDEIDANSYLNPSLEFSEDSLTDENKKLLQDQIKKDINQLYTSAIKQDEWESIADSFDDNEDLEDAYDDLLDDVKGGWLSDELTSFEVTNVKITSLTIDSDGNFAIYVNLAYKYSSLDSSDQTKEETDTDTVNLYYDATTKKLKLVDVYSLPSYF